MHTPSPSAVAPSAPLGVTLGDAAGIGPELILRLASSDALRAKLVVYSAGPLLDLTRAHLQRHDHVDDLWAGPIVALSLDAWRAGAAWPEPAPDAPAPLRVVDISPHLPADAQQALSALDGISFGAPNALFAHVQVVALDAAIDDAMEGRISGICTAPWTKAILGLIDLPPTGHTERLAARTRTPDVVMMLAGARLRVALVTTHIALRAVADALTPSKIVRTAAITARDLGARWGIKRPVLALAALNPHAGESGTMGDEEARILEPALTLARRDGLDLRGPFPADTLFARLAPSQPASAWPYDAVVCMYHDQALIPLKLLHFGRSANITLGLPIIRTSPDHGTAYDIAGHGRADTASMRYAVELAFELVARG